MSAALTPEQDAAVRAIVAEMIGKALAGTSDRLASAMLRPITPEQEAALKDSLREELSKGRASLSGDVSVSLAMEMGAVAREAALRALPKSITVSGECGEIAAGGPAQLLPGEVRIRG